MTRFDDKAELYALVADLHGRGWTTTTIGMAIGCSRKHVRTILVDLGLNNHVRHQSLEEALAALPEETAERVLRLRQVAMEPSRQHESVAGE